MEEETQPTKEEISETHKHKYDFDKIKHKFKDSWALEDKKCPTCGNITQKAKGLNRQNIKRLLSFKTNIDDVILLFIIIMVLFSAYSYNLETKECRNLLSQIEDNTSPLSVCLNENNNLLGNQSAYNQYATDLKKALDNIKLNSSINNTQHVNQSSGE